MFRDAATIDQRAVERAQAYAVYAAVLPVADERSVNIRDRVVVDVQDVVGILVGGSMRVSGDKQAVIGGKFGSYFSMSPASFEEQLERICLAAAERQGPVRNREEGHAWCGLMLGIFAVNLHFYRCTACLP